MAVLQTAFNLHIYFNDRNTNSIPIFTSKTSLDSCNSTLAQAIHTNPNSACVVRRMSVLHALKHDRENFMEEKNENALHIFVRWFELVRDIFPGGRWWILRNFEQNVDGSPIAAEPMAVLKALREMWALVADEKWILYTAFGTLIVAAVSMPGLLASSVFSAQNGEMLVFYQNSWLLILLCFTSGICSGLRSGCFAVANMILTGTYAELVNANGVFTRLFELQKDFSGKSSLYA